jgi:hypothetical protein
LAGVNRGQASIDLGLGPPLPLPDKHPLKRLLTTHGRGKRRRLRKAVTARELAEALEVVRTLRPNTNWLSPSATGITCHFALRRLLGKEQIHPKAGWDLVARYMKVKGIGTRQQALDELGIKPPRRDEREEVKD